MFDKENSGVSDTRNVGMLKAQGEYLQFVDSDDFIQKDMCSRMVFEMESNKADMVMCAMTVQQGDRRTTDTLAYGVYEDDDIPKNLLKIYKTNYINSPCNKMYRKELANEGFCEKLSLGEDLLFNLQYLQKCKRVVCIEDALYVYDYINGNSLTHVYRENAFEIATTLYKAVCEYGNHNRIDSETLRGAREVYINSIFYALQDLFYYSALDKKKKMEVLNNWMDETCVQECLTKTYTVEVQKQIICYLLRKRSPYMIRLFFEGKKLISNMRGGNE